MEKRFYRVRALARAAAVSERTLRYYDKEGLLSPSHYSEAGHRLYTDADLVKLQYIQALKFLGFALEEIRVCLQLGPQRLSEMLAQQKALMVAQRERLGTMILAMEDAERLLAAGPAGADPMEKLIEVVRMEQDRAWMNKYLTPEQRQQMRALAEMSYAKGALQKLAGRGWTEADQQRQQADYGHFRTELARLAAAGADPAGAEAQELARFVRAMNDRFTQGDPELRAGLRRTWENYNALPEEQRPPEYQIPEAEREFLKQAMAVLYRGQ